MQIGHTRYQTSIIVQIPIEGEIVPQSFERPEEFFDAYAVFDYLAIRELRLRGENEHFLRFQDYSSLYFQEIDKLGLFEKCKAELGITDAFQMRDCGKSLALPEFQS